MQRGPRCFVVREERERSDLALDSASSPASVVPCGWARTCGYLVWGALTRQACEHLGAAAWLSAGGVYEGGILTGPGWSPKVGGGHLGIIGYRHPSGKLMGEGATRRTALSMSG